jgi:hypothetical protein
MWKTLATRGSVAPRSVVVLASSDCLAGGEGVEPAFLMSFAEPATLGWPAASFSAESAAPGSGGGT